MVPDTRESCLDHIVIRGLPDADLFVLDESFSVNCLVLFKLNLNTTIEKRVQILGNLTLMDNKIKTAYFHPILNKLESSN